MSSDHQETLKSLEDNSSFTGNRSLTFEECKRLQEEYQLLFNHIPCNVLVIDRNFKIVRTNDRMQIDIGDLRGCFCYEGLKGADAPCTMCTAKKTFDDGKTHTGHHIWKTNKGETAHLHVVTVPLRQDNGSFDQVMEMAIDVTHAFQLEEELKFAYQYLETIIATSSDGVIAVNEKNKTTVFNPAARNLFGVQSEQIVSSEELGLMMPQGFLSHLSGASMNIRLPDAEIRTLEGEKVPVRVVGAPLKIDGERRGFAISVQDLKELKELEAAKIEAERMAIVGQTVAGLAHGLKNTVAALDGGMYMLKTGLKGGEIERIQEGMGTLSRNIDRISTTVRAFLNFSKERPLTTQWLNPLELTAEVMAAYTPIATKKGVELIEESTAAIDPVPLDNEGIRECLFNLVDNAIDACVEDSEREQHHVWVRTYEDEGAVIFEVEDDGCGMSYDVKQKVFSRFFTTKGLGGTGLGLLMTKKIVNAHGGTLDLSSTKGKGSSFCLRFPRNKPPIPNSASDAAGAVR